MEMLTTEGKSFFTDAASPVWEENRYWFSKRIEEGEKYYGFGERGGRLEKQGQKMTNWNTDPSSPHTAFVDPMYMSVPVYMVLRENFAYGVYVNSTWESTFDLTQPGQVRFESGGEELDVYIAYGPQPLQVIERLSELLGRMPMPPKWSLGYHQSRWSYSTEQEVRKLANTFREKEIPCDVIHLDIDYMDGYRVFTWNDFNFLDPARMISDLKRKNFNVVTIIDPGVKVDTKFSVYREGMEKGFFIRDARGKICSGYVWPDEAVFPDFSRADVRKWWGDCQHKLAAQGIGGIWNDMNEPSIFEKPFSLGGGRGDTLPLKAEQGEAAEVTTHAELHNLYGSQMAQASYEGMRRSKPNERTFHLTRSGFAGVQRWSASWMGDNGSCWEHLEMSIGQLINMGISGVPFVGADIGGFYGNATPELFARWMQIGALYPFSRGHTCMGTNPQEPWQFGEQVEAIAREYLSLRYRLMPYLYSVFWKAHQRGYPVWRSLFLHYPEDKQTYHIDDQVLIGRYLMAAPVIRPGQTARQVYLPEGVWFDWWDGHRYEGGRYILADAPLEKMPLYVRAGAVIPMGPAMQYVGEKALDPLSLYVFPGDKAEFTLYEDDGTSMNYTSGEFATTRYQVRGDDLTTELEIFEREGKYEVPLRTLHVILKDGKHFQQKQFVDSGNGRVIQFERSLR